MTRCFYHPERDTETRCSRCGKPICSDCRFEREGEVLCQRCLRRAEGQASTAGRVRSACEARHAWIGLCVPGLAQLFRGEAYKGWLLLLYFFLAWFSGEGVFVIIAYGLSIWDFFWPLVHEEAKGRAPFSFRQFTGIAIVLAGIVLLADNLNASLGILSDKSAGILAATLTILLGGFIIWYHCGARNGEVRHDD